MEPIQLCKISFSGQELNLLLKKLETQIKTSTPLTFTVKECYYLREAVLYFNTTGCNLKTPRSRAALLCAPAQASTLPVVHEEDARQAQNCLNQMNQIVGYPISGSTTPPFIQHAPLSESSSSNQPVATSNSETSSNSNFDYFWL